MNDENTRILSDEEIEKVYMKNYAPRIGDTLSFVSIIGWMTVAVGMFLLIVGFL